jgi:hypothetical protein
MSAVDREYSQPIGLSHPADRGASRDAHNRESANCMTVSAEIMNANRGSKAVMLHAGIGTLEDGDLDRFVVLGSTRRRSLPFLFR